MFKTRARLIAGFITVPMICLPRLRPLEKVQEATQLCSDSIHIVDLSVEVLILPGAYICNSNRCQVCVLLSIKIKKYAKGKCIRFPGFPPGFSER